MPQTLADIVSPLLPFGTVPMFAKPDTSIGAAEPELLTKVSGSGLEIASVVFFISFKVTS